MLNIGLTGGIGAGKSAASAALDAIGATIVDADKIAREVVERGTVGLDRVRAEFGDAVLDAEGALDRPALAAVVFNDQAALARLNAIVHPLVRARSQELVEAAGPDAVIVHDIPLLAEGSMAPSFHLVVVVHAPEELRVQRLTTARGMDRADALARIRAQADEQSRLAIADVVLDNAGSLESLGEQVARLWHERVTPYAEGLREHRPALVRIAPREGAAQRELARLAYAARSVGGSATLAGQHVQLSGAPERLRAALAAAGWFGDPTFSSADPAALLTAHIVDATGQVTAGG
ncbi:dephospho-CoA kinase [Cumulibacter manganitolerans]|uniref:dephospho-CoA kinase n=1 Tax=Cumulibacter manganitolerans TaxID=1884992 RepID=UPI00129779CA|nr:dephospho-CoA kinase [Cumulibacter manganitolerans]